MTKFTNSSRTHSPAPRWLLTIPRARRIMQADDGSLSIVQLLVVTFFAVVIVMLFHLVAAIQDKLELQNGADSAARTTAIWLSRGLNALSATNHLVGETTAMLAVHEAMAGYNPGGQQGDTDAEDKQLRDAWDALVALLVKHPELGWAAPFAFEKLEQDVLAGAAILEGKKDLKRELTRIYIAKVAYISSGNVAELRRQHDNEGELLKEDGRVDELLKRAIKLEPANRRLREVLPELRQYANDLVRLVPEAARLAAEEIGNRNNVVIRAYQLQPKESKELTPLRLPVYRQAKGDASRGDNDPLARAHDLSPIEPEWYGPQLPTAKYSPPAGVDQQPVTRRQVVKITQLCRATFPWVNYHREPILQYLKRPGLFKWSQLEKHYFDCSAGETIRVCDELQRDGFSLHVIDRYAGPDKGFEKWTDDPIDLDSLFSVVVVAERNRSKPVDGGYFTSMLPSRGLATAQAIVYNANPQQRHEKRIDLRTKRIVPWHQPKVGWDTLQWQERDDWSPNEPRTRYDNGMPYELIGKGTLLKPDYPRIRLAWQAKLTPASKALTAAALTEDQPQLAEMLESDQSPYAELLLTH